MTFSYNYKLFTNRLPTNYILTTTLRDFSLLCVSLLDKTAQESPHTSRSDVLAPAHVATLTCSSLRCSPPGHKHIPLRSKAAYRTAGKSVRRAAPKP